MATASNDMKNFYRQRKANKSGISKSSSKSKSKNISPKLAAAISSDLQDNNEKEEQLLMQFDMNMSYGPCVGMTRLARWERACRLGMNPPPEIGSLLKNGKVKQECLWDGRV